ncbi:MAG TPA: hypothetical protein VFJ19_07980 [Nocardioidaceae bacterium]|nr:hypothetical protein [Nocardioidaceae bacterium]
MRIRAAVAAAVAAVAASTTLITIPAASAHDREVQHRGSCSRHTDWKLKVKRDDRRLEVEAEVDSNRNGQAWKWRIRHDGHVAARGTRRTLPPSGSFEVHRRLANHRGADTIVFRARNPRSGEVCRASIRF